LQFFFYSLLKQLNRIKKQVQINLIINWFVFSLFLITLQVLDVAVSLAKVADVDRNLGKEKLATDGFQEAIDLLQSLTLKSEASGLEQRVRCL